MTLLLENGARPDFEDEYGRTPLSRAVTKRVFELLKPYCTKDDPVFLHNFTLTYLGT